MAPHARVIADFDSFWAVDWSGARSGYRGVAVARAPAGSAAVAEIPPPRGLAAWTRAALVERLAAEMTRGRILVGFDFAFSFATSSRPLLDLPRDASMPELWAEIDRRCGTDADHYGGAFVAQARPGVYWRKGSRPAGWDEGLRAVDLQARSAGGVRPESILKLVGTKQVGLASLAGMRALHALRRAVDGRLAVWPGPIARTQSVVVEIFPTLFRRAALGGTAKIRDRATLARALTHWDARLASPRGGRREDVALSDDLTDALVSAAALRQIARRPSAFDLPRDPAAEREGWIFGVSP